MTSSSLPATAESVVETFDEHRPTLAPADLVLLVLPALFVVGLAAGIGSSVALSSALAAAMMPALATLGYVLFYDPPATSA